MFIVTFDLLKKANVLPVVLIEIVYHYVLLLAPANQNYCYSSLHQWLEWYCVQSHLKLEQQSLRSVFLLFEQQWDIYSKSRRKRERAKNRMKKKRETFPWYFEKYRHNLHFKNNELHILGYSSSLTVHYCSLHKISLCKNFCLAINIGLWLPLFHANTMAEILWFLENSVNDTQSVETNFQRDVSNIVHSLIQSLKENCVTAETQRCIACISFLNPEQNLKTLPSIISELIQSELIQVLV